MKLSRDEMKYMRNIALLSLLLNFIIEVLNRDSILATFSSIVQKPHIFLYNTLIILLTLSVTLLLKHRIATCAMISILWIAFGITNNILLKFRTTPFTAVDFTLITEALPIMDKYLSLLQIIGLGIAIVLVIVALVFAFIKLPKHKGIVNYISNIVAFALILVVTLSLTTLGMNTNVLARNFGNIGDAFKDYGFAYCFANSLVNTGMDKPNNYSEETIQDIVDATEESTIVTPVPDTNDSLPEVDVEPKTPNIIFLQLESFFDPTHVEGLTFSSDPIPNYHELEENYTSGFLNVPSVGAGTANTEFEVITGMDLDFFGPGEYPYKTILKETACESMAYNLKELGYRTHAIHNNTATFYGRNKVFTNLGFDTFTSEEYMEHLTYNPLGWARDDVLVDEIMNALHSSDDTDYIYTISVQGHGKYPKDAQSLFSGQTSEGIDGDFEREAMSTSESTTSTSTDSVDSAKLDGSSNKNNEIKDSTSNTQGSEATINESSSTESTANYSYENEITIDGIDEDRRFAFEYYVNQIHEMDAFVGKLIETLEAYDEDVILVMYGDHLPSLGIQEEDLANKNMYQTPYIIWSSEGVLDGQYDRDLEAYQLSAYTLSLIHQNPGLLTKLHQNEFVAEAATEDDALDSTASIDSSNTASETLESDAVEVTASASSNQGSEVITYLDELELLQYDMLYGKQECFNRINPYEPTVLQYGIFPISIDRVEQSDGIVTVYGEHFTDFSKIVIDKNVIDCTRVDSNTLTFESKELERGTQLSVAQVTAEGTELTRTSTIEIE